MKTDIIAELTELLIEDGIKKKEKEVEALVTSYNQILTKEKEDALVNHLHNGGSEEDFNFLQEENDLLFLELEKSYREKLVREEEEEKAAVYKANLEEREGLIEQLRQIIQSEENIGKAFNSFKEIQEKWTSCGPVVQNEYSRVQSEYSRLRESFFYNINIYKELADNDKKINLSKKKRVIEKIKLLNEEKSINKLNEGIKPLLSEWDEIGPTFPKDWEIIREEFWGIARNIFDKINSHYENLRLNNEKNALAKRVLIDKIAKINESLSDKHKVWQSQTDEIKSVQAEWKTIGFASKEENDSLWQEFRSLCDTFFESKKAFYANLKKNSEANEIAKEAIINQAEFLKTSEDWKETTQQFLKLQEEWKKIGPASPRVENKLWKKFREHCDAYFDRKKTFFAGKDDREKENLKLKQSLVERIKTFTPTGNAQADLVALKEFSKEFREIGYVPFKDKNEIQQAYSNALDEKYKALKLEKAEKNKQLYLNKISVLKEAPNGE
ncbi:MAG: DUF349 domain-containing protein, partial [Bacteroidota bacterium]